MSKKSIAIIGGGASALMLACSLDGNKYTISVFEKNAALSRKFLVAGKGGFNLTHSEDHTQFANRYHPKEFIEPFLNHFSNADFREWLRSIGIETYVGTSKRVFPVKGIKPIEVLNAIEKELKRNNVAVHFNHTWSGWSNDELLFLRDGEITIKADIVVFAIGGASWRVTGSDGAWADHFKEKGITINPFYPSNCAYKINWDRELINQIAGQALKNCEFRCGNFIKKGEAVLTDFGIEGSGIYALSIAIRNELLSNERKANLSIDFKPGLSLAEIKNRIDNRGKLSMKDVLEKKLNLSSIQIQLIKSSSTKEEYNKPDFLAKLIKSFPLVLVDFAPVDDAISTVGGISLDEVNENLELKKLSDQYCIGEMLDWDAPTGGYLLQACFSMGKFLADYLNTRST